MVHLLTQGKEKKEIFVTRGTGDYRKEKKKKRKKFRKLEESKYRDFLLISQKNSV